MYVTFDGTSTHTRVHAHAHTGPRRHARAPACHRHTTHHASHHRLICVCMFVITACPQARGRLRKSEWPLPLSETRARRDPLLPRCRGNNSNSTINTRNMCAGDGKESAESSSAAGASQLRSSMWPKRGKSALHDFGTGHID